MISNNTVLILFVIFYLFVCKLIFKFFELDFILF